MRDRCRVHGDRGGGARHRQGHRRQGLQVQPAEHTLDPRRVVGVADQTIRQPQRDGVGGPGHADPGREPAGSSEILDRGVRSGRDDPQHRRSHPRPAATNRTRVPGESSAGRGRSRSHIGASVEPISCHPPGARRG